MNGRTNKTKISRIHGTITRRIFWLVLIFAVVLSVIILANYLLTKPESTQSPEESQPAWSNLLFMPGVEVGTMDKKRVTEASGMAASRKNRGVLWVHNDAGNSATIYAIKATGEFLGAYRVKQAKSRDWEDIAIGPGPEKGIDYIYIGNIGDNNLEYSSIAVYRVAEPNVDINQIAESAKKSEDERIGPAEEIELVYPDGPKNAETLLVDPLSGDIYIITKSSTLAMVYMAPFPQSTDQINTLEFVTTIPLAMATAGDVSPDGKSIIVRAAHIAGIWRREEDKLWKAFSAAPIWLDLMDEPQGEAICFDSDDKGFYTLSEMKHPGIYYFARSPRSPKPNL
jgi:hypothetical protein